MTHQIEQLLLSENDKNIRLGLTLYFSQNIGDIVNFSKWIYTTYLKWSNKSDVSWAILNSKPINENLTKELLTEIFNFYKCRYLINYIEENFKIRRIHFQFISKDIKYPDNRISDYSNLILCVSKSFKKELGI